MSSLPVQALVDDEQLLLRESKAGDRYSFAILYSRFHDRLLGMCLKKLGSRAAAEDAVQETFTRAYAAFADFDMRRPLWPWLAAIAENYCVDLYRRNGKSSLVEDLEDLQTSAKPDVALRDPTGNAVVEAERWDELARALEGLPPRQKRALLLFALEGWNYDDIASAEQTTVSSIKSLIWRARNYLRAVYEGPVIGAVLAPVLLLRRKARAGLMRAQTSSSRLSAELLCGAGGAVMQAALALMLVMPAQGLAPARDSEPMLVASGSQNAASVLGTAGSSAGHSASATNAVYNHRPPADIKNPDEFLGRELDPRDGATPEDTQFESIVASPNFPNDHTIYAGGAVSCLGGGQCRVLFVSRDSGQSWTRLEAEGFQGGPIMLPPNYPVDSRIFAMGVDGLRVSNDGGARFELLLPMHGTATMSPEANGTDQRVLIGSTTVTEYRTSTGVVHPVNVPVQSTADAVIAVPKDGNGDSTTVVGAETVSTQQPFSVSTVYRCEGDQCSMTELPGGLGSPAIKLSPNFMTDGIAFAVPSHGLFVSTDGARSFAPVQLPTGLTSAYDLALTPSDSSSGYDIVITGAKMGHKNPAIYRSSNLGKTWTTLPVEVPIFAAGTGALLVLPDRMIVASAIDGIACSSDGGHHWSARCPVSSSSS